MVAPDSPSDSAAGVFVPESVDEAKLVKSLHDDFCLTLADGQDQWKEKVVRIAHLSHVDTFDIIIAILALEIALKKFGAQVQLGKGLAADKEVLLEAY